MQIHKAQKSKSKIRIGLSGSSGSGKTYSALLLASGITSWDKICVIDTENGSGEFYSHLGPYDALTLPAPYAPEKFIEAIDTVEAAGYEVIIIDSVSHEWEGEGGILGLVDKVAQAKFRGNTWAAWSELTPRHQRLINRIVSSKCHIITTTRAKTDTVQVDGKVKKVGTKEIQREGFEYELTVSFTIDRDKHEAVASKDRTSLFIDQDPFLIGPEVGKKILDWCNSGLDLAKYAQEIEKKMSKNGVDLQKTLDYYKVKSLADLTYDKLNALENRLMEIENDSKKPKSGTKPPTSTQSVPPKPAPPAPKPAPNGPVRQKPAENVPAEPPADRALKGQISILERVLQKRAKEQKKGYQKVVDSILSKLGLNSLEGLSKAQVADIMKGVTAKIKQGDEELVKAAEDIFQSKAEEVQK